MEEVSTTLRYASHIIKRRSRRVLVRRHNAVEEYHD